MPTSGWTHTDWYAVPPVGDLLTPISHVSVKHGKVSVKLSHHASPHPFLWHLKVIREPAEIAGSRNHWLHTKPFFASFCLVKLIIRQQPAIKFRDEWASAWVWCDSCRLEEISSIFNHYHKQMRQRQVWWEGTNKKTQRVHSTVLKESLKNIREKKNPPTQCGVEVCTIIRHKYMLSLCFYFISIMQLNLLSCHTSDMLQSKLISVVRTYLHQSHNSFPARCLLYQLSSSNTLRLSCKIMKVFLPPAVMTHSASVWTNLTPKPQQFVRIILASNNLFVCMIIRCLGDVVCCLALVVHEGAH